MALTKNDMARVIIQALYNTNELPEQDNINVIRLTRKSKTFLKEQHTIAMNILNRKVKESF